MLTHALIFGPCIYDSACMTLLNRFDMISTVLFSLLYRLNSHRKALLLERSPLKMVGEMPRRPPELGAGAVPPPPPPPPPPLPPPPLLVPVAAADIECEGSGVCIGFCCGMLGF